MDDESLPKYQNDENTYSKFFQLENIFNLREPSNALSLYQIHTDQDEDYKFVQDYLEKGQYKLAKSIEEKRLSRAFAIFYGNALGDSLGAHTEFKKLSEQRKVVETGWDDPIFQNSSRCIPGIVTDDCSMARCLADSILVNDFKYNGIDLRMRFILWWSFGYNNTSKNNRSFGLGGNISEGFGKFQQKQTPFVSKEKGYVSGNGSIMRNGPVPIAFHENIYRAVQFANLQSLSTHDGAEAADCCRLLTYICVRLINYEGEYPKEDILDKTEEFIELFKSEYLAQENDLTPGIQAMANSEKEKDIKAYPVMYCKSQKDRNWNWRQQKFEYSPTREQQNSGYFGSYAMDGLFTALHIVYTTNSFKEAIFKAVNLGGDADSIAAITGQIAGAMYGLDEESLKMYYQKMLKFDEYTTFVKAYKLFKHERVDTELKYNLKNPQEEDQFYKNQQKKNSSNQSNQNETTQSLNDENISKEPSQKNNQEIEKEQVKEIDIDQNQEEKIEEENTTQIVKSLETNKQKSFKTNDENKDKQ